LTSPILNTKKALERRLNNQFSTTPTAYEGVAFTPPANALYFHTQFIVRPPEDPTLGLGFYREQMTFQVFVCDVINKGTANAISVAEQVRSLFNKGLTLTESGTRIHITRTPQIDSANVIEDRVVVPVLIEVWSEVYSG
jgi:hypothetical protein